MEDVGITSDCSQTETAREKGKSFLYACVVCVRAVRCKSQSVCG